MRVFHLLFLPVLMVAGVWGLQTVSSQQPPSAGAEIRAGNCMVQYINKVNVPAKAEGTLMELKFEEGDTVNAGDLLAVIDDTAPKLAIELKKAEEKEAIMNASNEVNLQDAINSEELARTEVEAFLDLRREGAIPMLEVKKKQLEAKRMKLRISLAEMQMKIDQIKMIAKGSELKIAEFELTRRQITSPATGFIETRIAQLGEWVQPGTPLATLIQMDRLRIEGDLDGLRNKSQIVKGAPVDITIYDGPENVNGIRMQGKLGYVAMEIDINGKHRVWVEVENQRTPTGDWLIKPGMRADIVIRNTVF
ncbi:MAG: efflux RND transporter periplasmic adaptor subunit [Rubripirellula sp.]